MAQERINLSGTWQFAFAANQKEADRLERFYTSDFAKSKFKLTPVPSNWALLGYEEPVYRGFKDNQAGEGFYVREFTIPQDWKDKRILLHYLAYIKCCSCRLIECFTCIIFSIDAMYIMSIGTDCYF